MCDVYYHSATSQGKRHEKITFIVTLTCLWFPWECECLGGVIHSLVMSKQRRPVVVCVTKSLFHARKASMGTVEDACVMRRMLPATGDAATQLGEPQNKTHKKSNILHLD